MMLVLMELHEDMCGSHIEGRSLEKRLLRVEYYFPTWLRDNSNLFSNVTNVNDFKVYIMPHKRPFNR